MPIVRVQGEKVNRNARDLVAGEEPMEIRLVAGGERATVAITMRTPGNDFELAAGFLHAEGIVKDREEIDLIRYCTEVDEDQHYNVVNVELRGSVLPALDRLERHFTVTSACGVCGKAQLDAIELRGAPRLASGTVVPVQTVTALPEVLRRNQDLFGATGGLHAAGLFDMQGELVALREDVGRHNAMDKLLGWAFLERRPLDDQLVCVSGRASFELLQKAVAARIPVFAAVSAPSSLAVDVALRYGVTLIGFLRNGRFNVYAGAERITGLEADPL
ncbi:MAG: formate dehydrogenase accessory sulfurtransferase FdhD [Trueperaceae bacterium]